MDLGSSGSSQSSSQGFRDLPPELQNAFKALATQAQSFLPGSYGNTTQPGVSTAAPAPMQPVSPANQPKYVSGRPGTEMAPDMSGASTQPTPFSAGIGSNIFTPLQQTAGETKAYDAINHGFTPTQSTFNSDVSMQMNPFDQSVIDTINRQGQGANSVLQQNLNSAGQFGSNRAFLGANDIDLSRLQQIGTFKQGQFNTAANNALTVLPGQRMADATGQINAGTAQRQLNQQTQQAPITALQSIAQILGILPTNSGQSQGNSSSFSFGLK